MAYRVNDAPATLAYASQVQSWMNLNWHHGPCPVCGADDWRADPQIFMLPLTMPAGALPEDAVPPGTPEDGLVSLQGNGRPVFPVVCSVCGYNVLVSALLSGVLGSSPVPGDLSGLD